MQETAEDVPFLSRTPLLRRWVLYLSSAVDGFGRFTVFPLLDNVFYRNAFNRRQTNQHQHLGGQGNGGEVFTLCEEFVAANRKDSVTEAKLLSFYELFNKEKPEEYHSL